MKLFVTDTQLPLDGWKTDNDYWYKFNVNNEIIYGILKSSRWAIIDDPDNFFKSLVILFKNFYRTKEIAEDQYQSLSNVVILSDKGQLLVDDGFYIYYYQDDTWRFQQVKL